VMAHVITGPRKDPYAHGSMEAACCIHDLVNSSGGSDHCSEQASCEPDALSPGGPGHLREGVPARAGTGDFGRGSPAGVVEILRGLSVTRSTGPTASCAGSPPTWWAQEQVQPILPSRMPAATGRQVAERGTTGARRGRAEGRPQLLRERWRARGKVASPGTRGCCATWPLARMATRARNTAARVSLLRKRRTTAVLRTGHDQHPSARQRLDPGALEP
jgi:hypothetical protein